MRWAQNFAWLVLMGFGGQKKLLQGVLGGWAAAGRPLPARKKLAELLGQPFSNGFWGKKGVEPGGLATTHAQAGMCTIQSTSPVGPRVRCPCWGEEA